MVKVVSVERNTATPTHHPWKIKFSEPVALRAEDEKDISSTWYTSMVGRDGDELAVYMWARDRLKGLGYGLD